MLPTLLKESIVLPKVKCKWTQRLSLLEFYSDFLWTSSCRARNPRGDLTSDDRTSVMHTAFPQSVMLGDEEVKWQNNGEKINFI